MTAGRTPRVEGRPRDLLVVGHTNIDRIVEVPRLPQRDRTIPVRGESVRLGGTAGNLARVAATEGLKVGLVSLVGNDFPTEFRTTLRREGVDADGVQVIPGGFTPTCTIFEDGRGSQMSVFRQGSMDDAKGVAVRLDLLRSASWVHLTTGDPDYQLRFAAAARKMGLPLAIDPAQELHYRWDGPRLRRLIGFAEILFGNRHEITQAAELLHLRSARELIGLVPLVVVTEGARGARAYSRTGVVQVRAEKLRGPSRITGAGDAFRGGFYAGWLGGEPLRACLVRGCRSAAKWMTTLPPSSHRRRKPGGNR
ncbi:MAG: carbohydrate kinase family protein [Thermoplasmata archaeon]|nr:carbohydrate kinase family protein [Thermoplasmata archaeon]